MTSYMVVVGDPAAARTSAETTVYGSEEEATAAAFRVLCGALAVLGPLPIERVGSRGLALSSSAGAVLTIDVIACEDAPTYRIVYPPRPVAAPGRTTDNLLRIAGETTTAAAEVEHQVGRPDVLSGLGVLGRVRPSVYGIASEKERSR